MKKRSDREDWTGHFRPNLEQLRQAGPDHNLTFIKNHLVGKSIEKSTGHTVEKLLSAFYLSFGGVPFLSGWEPMAWTAGEVTVEAKHKNVLRLLLALAWACTLTTHETDETESALVTVGAAIKSFRRQSWAAKAPRTTSSGDESRDLVKKYWTECPLSEQHRKPTYVVLKMAKDGKKISSRQVRSIASDLGLRARKARNGT